MRAADPLPDPAQVLLDRGTVAGQSGAVGSSPSLMRNGLPRASFARSSTSTISSSAPRFATSTW